MFFSSSCFWSVCELWITGMNECVYGRYDTDIWLDIGIQSYEAATGATLQSQSLFNNMSLEMFPFLATRRPTTLTTAPLRIVVLCRKFTTTSRGMFPYPATRRPTTPLSTAPRRIFVLCRKFTTTSRGMFPYLATRRPTTPVSTTLSTTATSAATRIFGLHLLQKPR